MRIYHQMASKFHKKCINILNISAYCFSLINVKPYYF